MVRNTELAHSSPRFTNYYTGILQQWKKRNVLKHVERARTFHSRFQHSFRSVVTPQIPSGANQSLSWHVLTSGGDRKWMRDQLTCVYRLPILYSRCYQLCEWANAYRKNPFCVSIQPALVEIESFYRAEVCHFSQSRPEYHLVIKRFTCSPSLRAHRLLSAHMSHWETFRRLVKGSENWQNRVNLNVFSHKMCTDKCMF